MTAVASSQVRRFGMRALSLAVAAALPGAASAQLEEVVVTAQKRTENLQDVPIAISAFTKDTMENMGITNTQDIQLATPSLVFASQTVLGQPYLRGVGTRFTLNGLEPSIATYVDDTYIPRGSGNQMELGIDVERVEVLKGPQGILYGRNATGGAIRIIKKPVTDEFEGEFKVGAGNYGMWQVAGTMNVPVSPTFGFRVSGQVEQRNGWQDNLAAGLPGIDPRVPSEINDKDVYGIAGRGRWLATDRLTVEFGFDYSNQDDYRGYDGSGLGPPALSLGVAALGGIQSTGRDEAATDSFVANDGDRWGTNVKAVYAFDSFDLISITTYADWEYNWTSDGDGTSGSFFTPANAYDQSQTFSQELRASSNTGGPLDWTFGLFFYDDEHETEFEFNTAILGHNSQGLQVTDTRAYAVFGQIGGDITENWRLTVGARYSYEEKESSIIETSLMNTVLGTMPGTLAAGRLPFALDADFGEFTPSATVEYRWGDSMAYVTYSRGFKSGGFNYPLYNTVPDPDPALAAADQQPGAVRPEILDMVELGLKGDYFDGTLRTNAAFFWYDYTDLQVQRPADVGAGTLTVNAGSATVVGLELDFNWVPTDAFSLNAGITLLDSKYDDFRVGRQAFNATRDGTINTATPTPGASAQFFDASGETLLRSSDFAGFISGQYEFKVPYGRVPVSLTYSYKGEYAFDFTNDPLMEDLGLVQDGYGLVSAKVSFVTDDERWTASLWGRNLTDETYFREVAANATGLRGYYAEPRMFGGEIKYAF